MSTLAPLPCPDSQPDTEAESQTAAVSLLAATKRLVEMIAAGASLTDILTNLCVAIDEQNPDMMSIVMLMDPDGQRLWPVAAPRLPSAFVDAISPLMIGENMGSCGTAAFRKERVVLSDVATDLLMSDLPAGLLVVDLATGEAVEPKGVDPKWAVRAARAGTPVAVIQAQLGHGSPMLTLTKYGRFLPSTADRAKWEAAATSHETERRRATTSG
jgi:hypothetical protein